MPAKNPAVTPMLSTGAPQKKGPLRWRRITYKLFMRREHRHELRGGDEVLANVRPSHRGWYWTSKGSVTPTFSGSEDECKAAARQDVISRERGEG